ncbi:MAG: glycosyltransferase family 2 protein [Bacteroidetes bacterium]|nr:MAG: glycosyltransferase family 2 protein [Bacteroidota bacterium]
MPKDLSIIIVNYNSTKLILDCLDTVFANTNSISFEVIVVDNDSREPGEAMIRSKYPEVKWIQMGYNAGFARANNAGIKSSQSSTILLLNPDTLATDESIGNCCRLLNTSEYVAAGVQLRNPDMTAQISGHHFMKGGLNILLPIPYWGNFLRWIAFKFGTRVPNIPVAKTIEDVDWISGAFLMVKKDVLDQSGLMDEDFFLYAEEVEWCSRIRKYGKLCIFGDLGIIHLQGEAINKDQNSSDKGYYGLFDKKSRQLILSNHLRVRKQYGIGWFLFDLLNYSWGVFVFGVLGFFESIFRLRNPLKHLADTFSFARNVATVWILAPAIIRNKPHFYKVM